MRDVIQNVRLSEAEHRLLKAAAAARGLTLSDAIRGPALREAEMFLQVVADRDRPAPSEKEVAT